MCVSPFGICFVLFCLVLFFWGNKGPFCGPSGPASQQMGKRVGAGGECGLALECRFALYLFITTEGFEVPRGAPTGGLFPGQA